MKTNLKAVLVLGVCGMLSQVGIARAEEASAQVSRSPSSVIAPSAEWSGRQGSDPLRGFRVPMLSEPRTPMPPMRWRLMGTCRQDIGMSQSVSGFGYGNCNDR